MARLESCGHEMYLSKNSWGNLEYKGINTRWVTQEGQRFEVQFHTRKASTPSRTLPTNPMSGSVTP